MTLCPVRQSIPTCIRANGTSMYVFSSPPSNSAINATTRTQNSIAIAPLKILSICPIRSRFTAWLFAIYFRFSLTYALIITSLKSSVSEISATSRLFWKYFSSASSHTCVSSSLRAVI
ncbi:unnamed protein product [Chrysodeixis includens]|uniref:Uncharacterized protein n=1 Tax=Chrysodeixis includens TaxID=689277 RepID=A0A9N8PZ27_CHRIL|nr:unnamed protein product [Chrysodeixis includens]